MNAITELQNSEVATVSLRS